MLPDRVVVTVIRGGGSRGVMGGCGGSAWVPNSATGFCCHCPKTYELANNRNRNSLLPPAQASPCGWGTTTFLLSWTVPWQPLSSHGFLGQNLCLEIYTLSKAILPQNTGLKKKNWFTPPKRVTIQIRLPWKWCQGAKMLVKKSLRAGIKPCDKCNSFTRHPMWWQCHSALGINTDANTAHRACQRNGLPHKSDRLRRVQCCGAPQKEHHQPHGDGDTRKRMRLREMWQHFLIRIHFRKNVSRLFHC